MIKTIEGIVEEDGRVRLLEPADVQPGKRALITFPDEDAQQETALLSEAALAEDWNREEEETAWQNLQQEP